MLANMSAQQFGEWMAFNLAEKQLHEEERERAALEREALAGADDIRNRIRS